MTGLEVLNTSVFLNTNDDTNKNKNIYLFVNRNPDLFNVIVIITILINFLAKLNLTFSPEVRIVDIPTLKIALQRCVECLDHLVSVTIWFFISVGSNTC